MSAMIHIPNDVLTLLEVRARNDMVALETIGVPHLFHTPKEREYGNRLVGLLGETALKLFLKLDWETHPGFGRDVDDFYEVRATKRANGNLITHKHDRTAVFVLARVIDTKHVQLAGWIDLQDANAADHWADWLPHPAFLTRADQLNDMATLPRKVAA